MECPACSRQLKLFTQTYDIPYFGKVFQSTFVCSCGYKFVDIYPYEEKEPVCYTLTVTEEEFSARVVKSSTCIINVPELGVRVDPGPCSEGIITNVEGILRKIENALEIAIRWGDASQKKEGKKILKKLKKVFEGKGHVTLILEDHRGFSFISSESVKKELLDPHK
jgi:zinc finger protein